MAARFQSHALYAPVDSAAKSACTDQFVRQVTSRFIIAPDVPANAGTRTLSRSIATGLLVLLLASGGTAHADGGKGGSGNTRLPGGQGGHGGTLTAPNGGDAGIGCAGVGGGGGGPGGTGGMGGHPGLGCTVGGVGGDGGAGGIHGLVGSNITPADVNGTAGAAGGIGESEPSGGTAGGSGGGGGAGGYGAIISGAGVASSIGTITAGAGGDGGDGGNNPGGVAGFGGDGGDGGVGLVFGGNSLTIFAKVSGGAGGAGGAGGIAIPFFGGVEGFGGSGGNGGDGGIALMFAGGSASNFSVIMGGDGGVGRIGVDGFGGVGSEVAKGGDGGSGGNGGTGVVLSAGNNTTFNNNAFGHIFGGNGASAGNGGLEGGSSGAGGPSNGVPGIAGVGGAGLVMLATNGVIQNEGTIQGGAGGAVIGGSTGPRPTAGAGGAGLSISGDSNLIVNSGSIQGGASGDGLERAPAIELGGSFNTIELRGGAALVGNVVAFGGGNVLNLYDSGDVSSDISGLFQVTNRPNASWTLRGVISGATQVTVAGGTLTLTGDNTYNVGTTITAGTLRLGDGSTTGTVVGDIANDGVVSFNRSDTPVFSAHITGAGSVTQDGAGTLTLTGINTYTGATVINAGTLALGGAGSIATSSGVQVMSAAAFDISNVSGTTASVRNLSGAGSVHLGAKSLDITDANGSFSGAIDGTGTLVKHGTGTLTLTAANTYTGSTNVAAGTLRAGATNAFSASSVHMVDASATLDLAGYTQSVAGLTNSGTVSLLGSTPGTNLTVTGAYVGNNGALRIGTMLAADGSVSDRLVLDGPTATASGHTTVQVTNLGGLGGLTTGNGIEVISALHGATTTAQTTSDAFALTNGHVDAGAYEYRLYAKDAAGSGENWYLRSTTTTTPTGPTTPGNPGTPSDPGNSGNPGVPGDPTDPTTPAGPANETDPGTPSLPATPADIVPTYRGEVPLLAALPEQIRQAGLTMLGNLHERIGDDDMHSDTASALDGDRHSWGRVLNRDLELRQGGVVNPESSGHLNGFQMGTDVFASRNWRAGAYLGQLDGDMNVDGLARGVTSLDVGHNHLRNRYLGIYGTYVSDSGIYADAVMQAGQHRNTIYALDSSSVDVEGNSLLVSLEMGLPFKLSEHWEFEPQLQVVHQDIDMDDASLTGARVRLDSDAGWLGRAGVRVKGVFSTGAGTLQPYARVNVYKSSGGDDIARFIGPAATTDIAANVGSTYTEVATGVTWTMSGKLSLFGEVGRLWGRSGERVDSPFKGSLGLRVNW